VLTEWRLKTPFKGKENLVFFGDGADHALNLRTFSDLFQRALVKAGVMVGERYLTCHSLRHTFNTAVHRVIPPDVLLALMGHRSSAMSDLYDHPEVADRIRALEGVRRQIEGAISW
jgi:integrase